MPDPTIFEIIILIVFAIYAIVLAWLVYSFRKERVDGQTAEDIGQILLYCESTDKNVAEVKTEIRKLIDKVDRNTESLSKDLCDGRNESTAALRQIGSSIDTLRSEFKQGIGKMEDRLTKSEERLTNRLDELSISNSELMNLLQKLLKSNNNDSE